MDIATRNRLEEKFQYMLNMRPALNKQALFSDTTSDFVSPAEPRPKDKVTFRFRTAKNNVDMVNLISGESVYTMEKAATDEVFDYYEVTRTGTVEYGSSELDRSVVNKNQIREVLLAYKKAIYEDLYPSRDAKWESIPKTLIFAKDDYHATQIVEVAKEVFKTEFKDEKLPEKFVQKITYSAGDSNALIRDLRTEREFRIAVTVTLVATGTDVKPLEVVLFMKDVHSDVLYTQMKGRGCRVISDDKLKEVTPNADTKECYYIVDAVGVTESEKHIPKPGNDPKKKKLSLEQLLEHLAHNEVSDENLILLRDYCSTIQRRYEDDVLFGRHLDYFISEYNFAPRTLANSINDAVMNGTLVEYISPSHDNTGRIALIYCLIGNLQARKKLLELQKGYWIETQESDELIYAGFSKESAKTYIENFEKYLNENKDSIEALRIIYNSEDTVITHNMLVELQDRLLVESRKYGVYQIWKNYKLLDDQGDPSLRLSRVPDLYR